MKTGRYLQPTTLHRELCAPVWMYTAPLVRTMSINGKVLKKNGKLSVPVLAVGGEISTSGPIMNDMMQKVAENVTAVRIPDTGHWVAEENADGFVTEVFAFLKKTSEE